MLSRYQEVREIEGSRNWDSTLIKYFTTTTKQCQLQLTLFRPKLSESQPQTGQPTAIPRNTICSDKRNNRSYLKLLFYMKDIDMT